MNDGIDPEFTSLQYLRVDEVAARVTRMGVLAKVDIEAAYRQVPVHPQDRPLQALRWENQVYVDPRLPFGLRSAPKIPPTPPPPGRVCLRRIRLMKCRSVVRDSVVPGPMGPLRRGSVNSGEGAYSHHSRVQHMGRSMGQEAGGVSLRQPSRSGQHTLKVKYEPRAHCTSSGAWCP